jgi:hypothetical protein
MFSQHPKDRKAHQKAGYRKLEHKARSLPYYWLQGSGPPTTRAQRGSENLPKLCVPIRMTSQTMKTRAMYYDKSSLIVLTTRPTGQKGTMLRSQSQQLSYYIRGATPLQIRDTTSLPFDVEERIVTSGLNQRDGCKGHAGGKPSSFLSALLFSYREDYQHRASRLVGREQSGLFAVKTLEVN